MLSAAGAIALGAAVPKAGLDVSKLPAPFAAPVDYQRDIRPILEKNCYSCHGPDKHKSGLRLDLKADALAGGDSGKVIIPGKSAESILIHNVAGLDPDAIMPPADDADPLKTDEIAKLRAWIDAGAVWPDDAAGAAGKARDHWAFKAPVLPAVPPIRDSGTEGGGDTEKKSSSPRPSVSPSLPAATNAIDAFILARLEQEKIKPSPEAERVTLIRRLTLDLTGLLPTPEETAAFVQDRRPDAYERVVDRLLASPHFGERWGRHWLDLARYADSDGYEKDSPRPFAYLYRDWVIDAVNRDLPFDQFTIEQLAGDLLPDATEQQKIATGFHRQTLTNKEGGIDKEEFRTKATVDRVSTTGAAWLGLTVGCAECHTHKYDPITQREFYQFYAFFNNAGELDIPAPRPAELAAYEQEVKVWEKQLAEIEPRLQAYMGNAELESKRAEWETMLRLPKSRWATVKPAKSVVVADGEENTLTPAKDNSITPRAQDALGARFIVEAAVTGKGLAGFRLEALEVAGKTAGRGPRGNFGVSEFRVEVQQGSGDPQKLELATARADTAARDGAATKAIDGTRETAWSVGPNAPGAHAIVFETKAPLDLAEGSKLIFTIEQASIGLMNRFRLATTTSAAPLDSSALPDAVLAILDVPAAQRTAKQKAELLRHYTEQADEEGRKLHADMAAHTAKKPKYPATTAAILVAEERKTNIHIRGDFLRKGDEVQAATLAVLPPLHARAERADRLDLARWLVDPANPLTARVTVNHVWKNLFGRALVTSVNDFGTRGDRPSHPELLDWLAVTFQSPPATQGLGWSRKALIKLIVSSAAYRQSSNARPDLIEIDPNNVLLARQNRFRLEAENVRDVFLAASGLLNPAIGGPSIKPALPADIAALGYANSVKWVESKGAEQYRRGLYIFFQRTVPYPMLMTFDAPDSNTSCTRRERSNTPLQALALLNDPVFFECAQALGKRVAREPLATDDRIRRAFQLCLSREPDPAEQARLKKLYAQDLELLQAHPENAARIAGESDATQLEEKAALVALCRVIMNLDEFVTRD
ncbi:MAG TPA: PSD1 and planctomycete cytochrome C domain-containing protein [Opitutaceae bacterium]|nr:PSD1 and planctomycete cytochrome C domain-containing protein [Opitutaceae bacterium]